MSDIEKVFPKAQVYDYDVWVADYTLQTQAKPKAERKGVVISRKALKDIGCFHLRNDRRVAMYGVNFEEHKGFFPKGCGDCECMFKAKEVNRGGWMLLCELKYGKDAIVNNMANAHKAFGQLRDTWNLLKRNRVVDTSKCKSYLNIAMPGHATPFDSYLVLQDEKWEWLRKNKIALMGVNEVLVVNEGILQVPKVEI